MLTNLQSHLCDVFNKYKPLIILLKPVFRIRYAWFQFKYARHKLKLLHILLIKKTLFKFPLHTHTRISKL